MLKQFSEAGPSDVEPKQIIETEIGGGETKKKKKQSLRINLVEKLKWDGGRAARAWKGGKTSRHPECGKELTCNPEFYQQQTYLPKQVRWRFPHKPKKFFKKRVFKPEFQTRELLKSVLSKEAKLSQKEGMT